MHWIVLCMLLLFARADALLLSRPPHAQYIPRALQYDHIMSADENYKQQILEKVLHFPVANYNIYLVRNLGMFFLDAKSDWIKDGLKNNEAWEAYLLPWIQKYAKPNTTVIDAGAHIGTHTFSLARAVGPQGMVLAFEPQPKTFCELFMNAQINKATNVYCFWGALGDRFEEIQLPNFYPGVEVIYLFDAFTWGYSGNNAPMIPLDSLNLNNISFMKVDVDGCDDIFLDGAKETILRNKPVLLMEILGGADFDNTTPEKREQILHTQKKIADLGYTLQRVSLYDYICVPIPN